MRRKKILLLLLILLLTTSCHQNKEKLDKNPFSQISYYQEQKQERYFRYQQQHSDLSAEEVVTAVNIGLDQAPYTNTKETPYLNTTYLLVNKYRYLPPTYIPEKLERIDPKYTNGNKQLVQEAKLAFEQMANDAESEGYTIRAVSAYRSYSYQQALYQNYVLQDGEKNADTYSARPGYSEHQTGLVVDIDNGKQDFNHFEETEEFKWMQENAKYYGYILRYPKGKENLTGYTYEAWHYRYVGKKIAQEMANKDITLAEYYVKYLENS